jgi:N6-L-threonylcarbamoyladenine synthase
MLVLGIESSCDESAAAVVEDGRKILSNVIATQIPFHEAYYGVVPEIASRKHTEWILPVVKESLREAGIRPEGLDGIAVTARPGLMGSLLVGLSFAKGLAWATGKPFVAIDHILAHLYAPHLENEIEFPYIGLLVSGGHTIISVVTGYDEFKVLGTTIDDAVGEAFDKVAKFYHLGYPGGVAIDRLAKSGDDRAFDFPNPSLHKGAHRYDVSYSGLKTAVINQLDQFQNPAYPKTNENIAASFQKAAVGLLIERLLRAVEDTGINTVVAGGGVAANSLLRARLAEVPGLRTIFPSPVLCTDNGAMVAGIGYIFLKRGDRSPLSVTASARVPGFRRRYP